MSTQSSNASNEPTNRQFRRLVERLERLTAPDAGPMSPGALRGFDAWLVDVQGLIDGMVDLLADGGELARLSCFRSGVLAILVEANNLYSRLDALREHVGEHIEEPDEWSPEIEQRERRRIAILRGAARGVEVSLAQAEQQAEQIEREGGKLEQISIEVLARLANGEHGVNASAAPRRRGSPGGVRLDD